MAGINRFCVMATLQAARAHMLGLKLDEAYSWGLNRACYSEDTYVLTEDGWKLHSDVSNTERIMVFSPRDDKMWYEKPSALLAYENSGEMVHFRSTLVDILTTPEHTIVCKWGSSRPWRITQAKALVKKRVILPAVADWVCKGSDMEWVEVPQFLKRNGSIGPTLLSAVKIPIATWLELAGYYLSEGGMDSKNHYNFTLAQSKKKPDYIDKIRYILRRLPFHSHEYSDDTMVRWNVGNKQLCEYISGEFGEGHQNKHIPSWIKNLPRHHLVTLFDSLLLGDGTFRNGRFIRYSSTSERLAYDVQEIAIKLGYSTNLRVAYAGYGRRDTLYQVTLRKATYHDVSKQKISFENYTGVVYCFSTSTGFYVTMRNGKIAFQGNTFYAAAKRGFKGGSGRTSGFRETENRPAEARPDVFRLGDDMAFRELRDGRMLFTIGGKVQSEADFKRQVASRFGEKFSAAWRDALDLLGNYDRDTLLSQNGFYRDVYKPNRDSLVEKWSGLVDAQVKKEKTAGRPSRP